MKKIDYRFKFLYAMGIIFVVAGHINGGAFNLFEDFFNYYSFHLALFTFASGYFYNSDNEKHIFKYIFNKFKKLIIPLFFWTLVYGIIMQIVKMKNFSFGNELTLYNLLISPFTHSHKYIFNLGTWFLGSLFFVEVFNIIFRFLTKKIKLNNYLYFMFYLLLGIFSVYIASNGYNNEWFLTLDRFLYLLPFYGLGTLYKTNLEKKDKIPSIYYFLILIAIALTIITMNGSTVHYIVAWCNDYDGHLFLPFIVGFMGIAFWLRIANILEPCLKNCKTLLLIADNTFSIMVHHLFAIFVLKYIFGEFSKFIPLFKGFNWHEFKTNVWYYFVPNGNNQWLICYLIVGIFVPILISKIIELIKKMIKKITKKAIS